MLTPEERDEILITLRVRVESLDEEIGRIDDKLDKRLAHIEAQYVHRAEFYPIRAFVYGLIILILGAVGGALLRLVLIGGFK